MPVMCRSDYRKVKLAYVLRGSVERGSADFLVARAQYVVIRLLSLSVLVADARDQRFADGLDETAAGAGGRAVLVTVLAVLEIVFVADELFRLLAQLFAQRVQQRGSRAQLCERTEKFSP